MIDDESDLLKLGAQARFQARTVQEVLKRRFPGATSISYAGVEILPGTGLAKVFIEVDTPNSETPKPFFLEEIGFLLGLGHLTSLPAPSFTWRA